MTIINKLEKFLIYKQFNTKYHSIHQQTHIDTK